MSTPSMDFVPGPFSRFRPDLPFNQRWGPLKSHLERLYLDENKKLSEIMAIMKSQYGFDANESQYKHKLKTWMWKKNIPTAKKAQICKAIQTRADIGRSVNVKYKGVEVAQHKLRRYVKDIFRQQAVFLSPTQHSGLPNRGIFNSLLPLGNTIFLRWNISHQTIAAWQASVLANGVFSPSSFRELSPIADVEITTSSEHLASPNPGNELLKSLSMRCKVERAHLFAQGKVEDLMLSMNSSEQKTTVRWLNQFYLFSYRTAKNWGWGPQDWNARNLGFYNSRGNVYQQLSDRAYAQFDELPQPSQLCRWSIHLDRDEWDELSFVSSGSTAPDPEDESTWRHWQHSCERPPFEQKLAEALRSNAFSSLEEHDLPLSSKMIAEAADSSDELLLEALGFSIISGNANLMLDLIDKAKRAKLDMSSLYPYHLATTYLDGAQTCCNLLHRLVLSLWQELPLYKNNTNALGHTVLDNLMITVLKSHTKTPPGLVDQALANESSFKGEEIDICSRWEADSECYLALLACGRSSVPFEWKHKFCHTAAQTICHSIAILDWHVVDLNSSSGLFLRYCTNCGLKLQLRPLHTLVLVAFQLAQSGCEGEDLFGALACLLQLLSDGANPQLSANISFSALLGQESPSQSDHEELRPSHLAQRVPPEIVNQWSASAQTGWQVFCLVLRHAQDTWTIALDDYGEDTDKPLPWNSMADIDKHFEETCQNHQGNIIPSCFGTSTHLGHI